MPLIFVARALFGATPAPHDTSVKSALAADIESRTINAAEFGPELRRNRELRHAVFRALDRDHDGLLDAEPFEVSADTQRRARKWERRSLFAAHFRGHAPIVAAPSLESANQALSTADHLTQLSWLASLPEGLGVSSAIADVIPGLGRCIAALMRAQGLLVQQGRETAMDASTTALTTGEMDAKVYESVWDLRRKLWTGVAALLPDKSVQKTIASDTFFEASLTSLVPTPGNICDANVDKAVCDVDKELREVMRVIEEKYRTPQKDTPLQFWRYSGVDPQNNPLKLLKEQHLKPALAKLVQRAKKAQRERAQETWVSWGLKKLGAVRESITGKTVEALGGLGVGVMAPVTSVYTACDIVHRLGDLADAVATLRAEGRDRKEQCSALSNLAGMWSAESA